MESIKKIRCVTINTDASFHPEFKIGGYAFYIISDLFKIQKGGEFKTNPMNSTDAEIMCIGNAIATLLSQKELPHSDWLIINTDSKYGIEIIRKQKSELGKSVFRLWQKLIHKLKSKNNQFRHVKAHSGKDDARSHVNEWCDKTAKNWMRNSLKKRIEN